MVLLVLLWEFQVLIVDAESVDAAVQADSGKRVNDWTSALSTLAGCCWGNVKLSLFSSFGTGQPKGLKMHHSPR